MSAQPKPDPVWPHSVRCPKCNALNDSEARWCMQCFKSFIPNPRRSLLPGERHLNVFGRQPIAPTEVVAPEVDIDGLGSLVGEWDGKAVWKCARCFTRNEIRSDVCTDCGLTYVESVERLVDGVVSLKMRSSERTAVGIVGMGARVMMLAAGLVAPVLFVVTVLYEAASRLMRRILR